MVDGDIFYGKLMSIGQMSWSGGMNAAFQLSQIVPNVQIVTMPEHDEIPDEHHIETAESDDQIRLSKEEVHFIILVNGMIIGVDRFIAEEVLARMQEESAGFEEF